MELNPKTYKSKYKNILFAAIVAIMLLTSFIENIGIIKIKFEPLLGFTDIVSRPKFSIESWLNAEFQDSLNTYLDNNTIFRPPLIRLFNELSFRFFNKSTAKTVIIGKNNQLYQTGYILEHNGDYFVGEELIQKRCERIKYIQDTLNNLGIKLLVVFAPGKASTMPEFIPERFKKNNNAQTNYQTYTKFCKNLKINTLDLQNYFLQIKDTTSWPIYPTYGVHWSDYGMYLALDTFLNNASNLCGKYIPQLSISGIEKTNIPRGEDYDTGNLLNLFSSLKEVELAYPQFSKSDTVKPELNILFIGDSYIFHWLKFSLGEYLFKSYKFWYYNVMVYPDFYKNTLYNYQLDIKEELLKYDLIVLECAETFMSTAFWNFEDIAYKLFNPNYKTDGVFCYQNIITKDRDQFSQIYENSVKNKTSVQIELQKEAELRNAESPIGSVEYYVNNIKNNKEWLEQISKQAKEKNIPLEQAILENAIWMAEHQ